MKSTMLCLTCMLVLASGGLAGISTNGLVFYIDASAPGVDPATTWEPIIGVGGTLGSTGGGLPVYTSPGESQDGFGHYFFNGDISSAGSYADYSGNPQVDFNGTTPFTLEVWMRPAIYQINGTTTIFGTESNTTDTLNQGNGWSLWGTHRYDRAAPGHTTAEGLGATSGRICMADREGVMHVYRSGSGYAAAGNNWTHIVLTYDPTNANADTWPEIVCYSNGAALAVETLNSGDRDPRVDSNFIHTPAGNLWVGVEPSDPRTSYKGDIGSIRIYDRKLSTDEISANYTAGPTSVLSFIGDIIESNGSTEVIENGATDSFDVVLTSAPSSDVIIHVNQINHTADPNQIGFDKTSLTFTSSNWNTPQTVTITALDDSMPEGIKTVDVFCTSSSIDANFDSQLFPYITVTIVDDDAGEVLADKALLTVSEEGPTSDVISVWLSVAPLSDNVVIDISYDDQQVTLDKTQLTFTTSNWNVPQTVTVTAIDDTVYEADPTSTYLTSAIAEGSDSIYTTTVIPQIEVSIADNDCGPGRYLPGDADENCIINFDDFALLAFNWLDCSLPNVDGCVMP